MTSFTALNPGAGFTDRVNRDSFSDYSTLENTPFPSLRSGGSQGQSSPDVPSLKRVSEGDSRSPQGGDLGKVYLVGAGPGDPGLLTVKALRLLERADVVIYDALVSAPILELICPTAQRIDVGKRSGRHSLPQEETNQLLVAQAQRHKIVVRLKGGDPFIFGRGGEEMEELVAAGVEVEVVPGITAGIAAPAYVGIPLTHRHYSSSVTFVTGHESTGKYRSPVDWTAIANGAETIVIYMGVHTLPQVTVTLMEAGRSPDTAVALVRWGTRPDAEELYGTLEDIVEKVQENNFAAPAIAVIGDVVNFRHHILSMQAMGATPPMAGTCD
ncbi:MAG: uroporphyrinogen-III C-methyltransferase [Cyanobacteria bacterium P01_C01_bin.89]